MTEPGEAVGDISYEDGETAPRDGATGWHAYQERTSVLVRTRHSSSTRSCPRGPASPWPPAGAAKARLRTAPAKEFPCSNVGCAARTGICAAMAGHGVAERVRRPA
ncbi:hypothetical protein [Streptomyces sp. NPDC058308]|uniref:hypothetical protein n=1 Tax=Streptomyces sp. NPDC058308 TaxID=3346440 RepID=UPI0036E5E0D5